MRLQRPMAMFRTLAVAFVLVMLFGVAAANNDDGFVWIDANTRIKVIKPVSAAGGRARRRSAPQAKRRPKRRKSRAK